MTTRLHEALVYHEQGYHPIPITRGTKVLALAPGKRKAYEDRPPTIHELRKWFPERTDRNIALLLGPLPHLLVLNVNMKHGNDGLATLRGYHLPPTPTILTPHNGLAYMFRPPDRERFPFPFKVHFPEELPGIELRGTGGYQLVPSSQVDATTQRNGNSDAAGAYRFEEPWQLERLYLDCADVPEWLRDLWIHLDRTDTPHANPRRSRGGPYTVVPEKPGTTVYGGQVLGKAGVLTLMRDTTAELTCAYWLAQRWGMPSDAVATVGRSFRCILPHHEDAHPSATLSWSRSGELMYHDWHRLDGKEWWTLPEVYAAVYTGAAVPLPGPSLAVWRLRLLIETKVVEPYRVDLPSLPDEAPRSVQRVYEGFRLLLACKWTWEPGPPTVFGRNFAAGWCGVGSEAAGKAVHWLVGRRVLLRAGRYKSRPLYLPGALG